MAGSLGSYALNRVVLNGTAHVDLGPVGPAWAHILMVPGDVFLLEPLMDLYQRTPRADVYLLEVQ